jgi:hypothetical protein
MSIAWAIFALYIAYEASLFAGTRIVDCARIGM